MSFSTRGFTLIELSVVLVIIGLIVGGVLAGQSLIRAAQLRTIITDKDRYITAVNTFRTKFEALPGDMLNATNFWGVHWGNASDNYTTSCYGWFGAASPTTCNGNGDGMIAAPAGPGFWQQIFPGGNAENVLAWQHLANAGLISGNYMAGVPQSTVGPYEMVGVNIPTSRANSNAGFSIAWLCATDTVFQPSRCGHTIFYGAQSPTAVGNISDLAMYPTLTTLEAYSIDMKIDDGKPGTGSVTALPTGNSWFPTTNCTTTAVESTAVYAGSTTGAQCALMFNAGF